MMNRAKQMYDYYVRPVLGEKGQDMVEYAMMLAIIVGIGWMIYNQAQIQDSIKEVFQNSTDLMSEAAKNSAQPPAGGESGKV